MNRALAYVIVTALLFIACCIAISVLFAIALLFSAFVFWTAPTILLTAYAIRLAVAIAALCTLIIMSAGGKDIVQGFIESYQRGTRR